MRRLVILLVVMLAAGAMAYGVAAQQVSAVPRVGLLIPGSAEQRGGSRARDEFLEGIRSLGWVEGSTFSIQDRFANGDPGSLSASAAEFAAEKVEVIVAFSSLAASAAHQATSVIPIVMDAGDPVALGLVASLGRPGGNVTGLSWMALDLVAKQLEMLKETVPRVSKIGVLLHPDVPVHAEEITELQRAAPALGLSVLPVAVGLARDLPRRFDGMTGAGVDAYFVLNDPRTDAMEIAALALRHHLPGAAMQRGYVDSGMLLSYGINLSAIHRRLAFFVDKILKGAKPADLPVEQPTTFELVVNLKTAKALDIEIPPSILARADEVIE
jgi:putative tryptophan/tyrosine transport system substrate-binding protein